MKKIEKPIIELSNICHSTKKAIVDRLYISVTKGDCFAVVYKDENNIDLLLDILAGNITPKSGKIFFKGDDITGTKNNFGIVPRIPSVPKRKTTAEFADAPIVRRGLSRAMTDILVRKELAAVGLSDIADIPFGKMSIEEQAKAFVFAAYMCSHELIVIDEPFSQLDSAKRTVHMEWLMNLCKTNGTSLLIFTKEAELAAEYADLVMIADKNTASNGIIAVDKRKKERALEQINERLMTAYKPVSQGLSKWL